MPGRRTTLLLIAFGVTLTTVAAQTDLRPS